MLASLKGGGAVLELVVASLAAAETRAVVEIDHHGHAYGHGLL